MHRLDELKPLPGLADVTASAARAYSMRVGLNTDNMARLGVTPSDVAAALRAQNAQYAAGKIGTEPAPPGQAIVYTVTATGRLIDPEQFGDIVVRASFSNAGPGGVLRIKDIARIELGALNYDTSNTLDGKPTIGMAAFLQPGSNALEVAQLVRNRMAVLERMRGVSGAVLAIVLVRGAVFTPGACLGGIAAHLYRQFAVTLAFAVVSSGCIALTLTPPLCAILMKKGAYESRLIRAFSLG